MKGPKNLKTEKEKLELLEQEKERIRDDINQLALKYSESISSMVEAAEALNKLPLESLKDICDFKSGRRKSYGDIIRIKAELENEKEKKLKRLEDIDSDIYMSKIDILLSKIANIDDKLDNHG